ncbi:MAG TPA: hypothetical protein VFW07_05400 [Parafilimonas sp.]|nr:hypothetical protein [Parafilimonas sp.]
METGVLEDEMQSYFIQLNESEKKSVIDLLRTFLSGRKKYSSVSIEEYNKELAEAEAEIERGESYEHDDVKKMSADWSNGK